jgi:CRP/FNR family transcriptional regulator, cyclic AMP receptor protein
MVTKKIKAIQGFDPQPFLASVGDGKTVVKYQPKQAIFRQGEAAAAVFYIE